jgi:transposase
VTALQALRGVAQETAVTVALEFGSFSRFERAPQAMGYTGLVSSAYTSGSKKRQGAITKTGNSHLRRALVEAP